MAVNQQPNRGMNVHRRNRAKVGHPATHSRRQLSGSPISLVTEILYLRQLHQRMNRIRSIVGLAIRAKIINDFSKTWSKLQQVKCISIKVKNLLVSLRLVLMVFLWYQAQPIMEVLASQQAEV